MKVYVDDNEDYRITYSSRDGSECLESMGMQPIIVESLSDYTKQVRKDVAQEVLSIIDNKFNCYGYVEEKFDDIKKYVEAQIQGETECQKK